MALMITLMTLSVLVVIVAHVMGSATVARNRVYARVHEAKCRRALDSVPGLAARILTEEGTDVQVDTLGDEWARPKYFEIGDVRVEIRIEDCARRYDLKGLLEEEPERLESNIEAFVVLATGCGLDESTARNLASAISQEAEARRLEDLTQTTDAEGETATTEETVPIWLEDFLSLPQLTITDRRAIRAAYALREDPETFETITVRFLDQITMWRSAQLNVNTAGYELLRYGLPNLADRPEIVDDLIAQREEEPFQNSSQIGGILGLDQDAARQLVTQVRLNSMRFRVTATATLVRGKASFPVRPAEMVLILERKGGNTFTTLWRHSSV